MEHDVHAGIKASDKSQFLARISIKDALTCFQNPCSKKNARDNLATWLINTCKSRREICVDEKYLYDFVDTIFKLALDYFYAELENNYERRAILDGKVGTLREVEGISCLETNMAFFISFGDFLDSLKLYEVEKIPYIL